MATATGGRLMPGDYSCRPFAPAGPPSTRPGKANHASPPAGHCMIIEGKPTGGAGQLPGLRMLVCRGEA